MNLYIFFREGGWYPIEIESDDEAIRQAKVNIGTQRVYRVCQAGGTKGMWVEVWKSENLKSFVKSSV